MTRAEINLAKTLLADRADRTETIGSDTDGGLSLTVHWTDGGQKIFHTIDEVQEFDAEAKRRNKSLGNSTLTLSQAKKQGYTIAGEFGSRRGSYLAYRPEDRDEALRQWAALDDDSAAFDRDPFADGEVGRRPWVLVAVSD